MRQSDLVIRSRRVVRAGQVAPAAIRIGHGKIAEVGSPDAFAEATGVVVLDVGDAAVLPGLVDVHVHVNEPGRTEWEGFHTATRAAAAGGITTLVDMPLNSSPVTTTVGALREKVRAALGRCRVDYAFWGGIVPGNAPELDALADAGLRGFKTFLVHSGIDEFPNSDEATLREAMPILARRGAALLVHAELPGPIDAAARGRPPGAQLRRYADYLASRPRAAEQEAIEMVIRLCREYGTPVHIVHLASAGAVEALREARGEGLPLTVETCPHYLAFCAEQIPDGATQFKCAPPIRERANRDALWAALREGVIDMISSDHSPCPPEMKGVEAGDFGAAWGGISSLQLGLPVMWTEASARGFGLEKIAQWMSRAPARLAHLGRRKGEIEPGHDADLVVFDPDATFTADGALLQHRHKLTPYTGRPLRGVVQMTFLRGACIYEKGRFPGEAFGMRLDEAPLA